MVSPTTSLSTRFIVLPPSSSQQPQQTHINLSKELWNALSERIDSTASAVQEGKREEEKERRIAVVVRSRYVEIAQGKGKGKGRGREGLVVFAMLDNGGNGVGSGSGVTSSTNKPHIPTHTISIPHSLYLSHPSLFSPPPNNSKPTLLISPTTPLPLSSIILLSLTSHSYTYATSDQAEFETRLRGNEIGIVREGDLICLDRDGGKGEEGGKEGMKWRIAMTEPVLQGVVKRGTTRFSVLPSVEKEEESIEEGEGEGVGDSDDEMGEGGFEEVEEEEDDFTIDEAFLSNVLPSFSSITPSSLPLSPLSSHSHNQFDHPLLPSGIPITPSPLLHQIPSQLLTPPPEKEEDDNARFYLPTRDLGRVGAFSGDWVVVRRQGEGIEERDGEEERLVRVFAGDGLVGGGGEERGEKGSIRGYFPPTILHNLSPLSLSPTLYLTPTSLSPNSTPNFPTASSVTVARIASPHSVNRVYQPLFLEGLRQYFQGKKRICKKGDLMAVSICEEVGRFTENKEDGVDDIDLPTSSEVPTAIVFFQITSLELPSPALTSNSLTTSGEDDLSMRVKRGKLGCFVDPKVTKLVQTGSERSLVPDVAGFMGLSDGAIIDTTLNLLGDPTPASRLFEYTTAALRRGAKDYDLHLTVLLKGARGSGKRTVVKGVAKKAGFHFFELDCFDLIGETDLKTEGHLKARIEKAVSCSPCVLLLRNLEALARKSQALETGQEPAIATVLTECFTIARQGWKASGFPIIIVGTTCDVEQIPTGVLGGFKEEISLEAPGEPERLSILRSLTSGDNVAPDVSLRALAIQTAALVANDLVDLVRRARSSAADNIFSTISSARIEDLNNGGITLTSLDFNAALEKARNSYSESIGAPKIPSVTWDDVGGLANVKSDILDTIQLPLEHPELFADGLKKRSGILLYGPPGTGKTLLAKAVATSCSLNFFSVKGPELLNMYIGESEANVRRVFQRARDAKPCVIFFDELDSVAPKRGNQGDSGGVMDRIVSQLLAELDGMAEGKGGSDVFVIGATNRPDLLDPALLRPGRFDRMLYLGVSDNHDSQLKIIQALTRKFKLDPNIQLEHVAQLCPFNYTGADFYALCSDAMLKAMTRKAEEIDTKIALMNQSPPYSTGQLLTPQYYLAELALPAEMEVLVSQQDFEAALSELVPSVSQAEMLHYKVVQQRFSGETMNSEEKMAQKQIEMPLPVTNGVKINGNMNGNGNGNGNKAVVVVNGHGGEEDFVPSRKDKGKGKAVQDETLDL